MINVITVTAFDIEADNLTNYFHQVIFLHDPGFFVVGSIKTQALVDLVAADSTQIVAVKIEEHCLDHLLGIVNCRQVTGPDTFVDFFETLTDTTGSVFGNSNIDVAQVRVGINIFEKRLNFLITTVTKSPQERCHRDFALAVYLNSDDAVSISFHF